MSVDHTKVVYYSGFSAYKNVNVYETTIEVDGSNIASGTAKSFTRTITVPEDSNYATIQIQANYSEGSPPTTPGPLTWQDFPAAKLLHLELDTDPDSNGTWQCYFFMRIDGSQVTFGINAFNGSGSDFDFVPISIGVRYAIHTVS